MNKLLRFIGVTITCALLGGIFWFLGTNFNDIAAISDLTTECDLYIFVATGAAIGVILGIVGVLRR